MVDHCKRNNEIETYGNSACIVLYQTVIADLAALRTSPTCQSFRSRLLKVILARCIVLRNTVGRGRSPWVVWNVIGLP